MPRKSPEELNTTSAPAPAPKAEAPAKAEESGKTIQYKEQAVPAVTASSGESMKDFTQNPYKKWIYLAQAVDSWRIWPRAFMSVYIILVYQVINWFMTLPEPNMNQAGLISVVVGAGAAWFGLYLGSSPRK